MKTIPQNLALLCTALSLSVSGSILAENHQDKEKGDGKPAGEKASPAPESGKKASPAPKVQQAIPVEKPPTKPASPPAKPEAKAPAKPTQPGVEPPAVTKEKKEAASAGSSSDSSAKRLFHAQEAVRHLGAAGLKDEAAVLKEKITKIESELKKAADERKAKAEVRRKEMQAWQDAQGSKLADFRKRVDELKTQLEAVQKGLSELTTEPKAKPEPKEEGKK